MNSCELAYILSIKKDIMKIKVFSITKLADSLCVLCLLCALCASCTDKLDEQPDSRWIDINDAKKVRQLLTSGYPKAVPAVVCELMGDNLVDNNVVVPATHNDAYSLFHEEAYKWEDVKSYSTGEDDTPYEIWDRYYYGIATANHAIEAMKEMSAEPWNDPDIASSWGEAHLMRAYFHFVLVNVFAEAYKNEAMSSQDWGIPYVTTVEDVVNIDYSDTIFSKRVNEVYRLIEKDLLEGINLIDDSKYQVPAYHFNRNAAYAFAARFYLFWRKYDLCVKYADMALGGNPATSLRKWASMSANTIYTLLNDYNDETAACNYLLQTTYSLQDRMLSACRYAINDGTKDQTQKERVLWTTKGQAVEGRFDIPGTTFQISEDNGLEAGDTLRIYFKSEVNEPAISVTYKNNDADTELYLENEKDNLKIAVADDAMAQDIRQGGLSLHGQGWTASRITLEKKDYASTVGTVPNVTNTKDILYEGGGPNWSGRVPAFDGKIYRWGAGSEYGSWLFRVYEYFEYTNKIAGIGYVHIIYQPLTAEETLLCRAEAKLYLGQREAAIQDLEFWTASKMISNPLTQDGINRKYSGSPATNDWADDMHPAEMGFEKILEGDDLNVLRCVLHFRRIETMFEGMRWFDIKRYGITVHHAYRGPQEYNVTHDYLRWDDPRRVLKVPYNVKDAGYDPEKGNRALQTGGGDNMTAVQQKAKLPQ